MNDNQSTCLFRLPEILYLDIKQKSNPEDCMRYLKALMGNRYAIKQLRLFNRIS